MIKSNYAVEVFVTFSFLTLDEMVTILKNYDDNDYVMNELTFGAESNEYGEFLGSYWVKIKNSCCGISGKERVLQLTQQALDELDDYTVIGESAL